MDTIETPLEKIGVFANMIGTIVCTPTTATTGESIRVEVRSPVGTPYENRETLPISINGVPGSLQYLTWNVAGPKTITVIASRPEGPPQVATTTVQINASATPPPKLVISWDPARPGVATLRVAGLAPVFMKDDPRLAIPGFVAKVAAPRIFGEKVTPVAAATLAAGGAPPAAVVAEKPSAVVAEKPSAVVAEKPSAVAEKPSAVAEKPPTATPAAVAIAIEKATTTPAAAKLVPFTGAVELSTEPFNWDFGDGKTKGSSGASVSHDFGAQLGTERLYEIFHVSVTVKRQNDDPAVTLRRSIAVHNPYVMMKTRGFLQPPVTSSDATAKLYKDAWYAHVEIRNPEQTELTLNAQRIELLFDDSKRDRELLDSETVSVTLKPGSNTKVSVKLPKLKLPDDAVAFAAHLSGVGPNSVPIRVTAVFDIPEHCTAPKYQLSDAAISLLDGLAKKGLIAKSTGVHASELAALRDSGAITKQQFALAVAPAPPKPPVMGDHMQTPNAVDGQTCDPWNLPEVIPDGMFCMPTQDVQTVRMPPRFMNARKGDIILAPSDGSLISAVLGAVHPPQAFSHSGMMTRDRDEITHSTASQDRMMDSNYTDSGGIRPDILKYMWPGVITQSIGDAVGGSTFVDPETGTPYSVGGFSSIYAYTDAFPGCGGTLANMMVVKPNPLDETTDVRTTLHTIADFAIQQAGKGHYSFFCYTDPTVAPAQKAPDDAKWAAGTYPCCCSSLVWLSVRSAGGFTIEGALEDTDIQGGAEISANTPDGLYVYTAAERLTAGNLLYNMLCDLVAQQIGPALDLLTDIPSNFANQILNTFATNWADGDSDDSDKWKQTTDANAVSPQNLTFYDRPHYGYTETLIFRDWRTETVPVYKWKQVSSLGTLAGVVKYKGQPLSGVDVQLTAAQADHSDDNGRFKIDHVPVGDVLVLAQKVIDDQLWSAKVPATIKLNQTTDVTIDLAPPPASFRRVLIDCSVTVIYYEWNAAANPRNDASTTAFVDLDRNDTHVPKSFWASVDGVMGRMYFDFDLKTDDSIDVTRTIRCYNSYNEDDPENPDSTDYQEYVAPVLNLKPGEKHSSWQYSDGDNYAAASYTLTNITDPSGNAD